MLWKLFAAGPIAGAVPALQAIPGGHAELSSTAFEELHVVDRALDGKDLPQCRFSLRSSRPPSISDEAPPGEARGQCAIWAIRAGRLLQLPAWRDQTPMRTKEQSSRHVRPSRNHWSFILS